MKKMIYLTELQWAMLEYITDGAPTELFEEYTGLSLEDDNTTPDLLVAAKDFIIQRAWADFIDYFDLSLADWEQAHADFLVDRALQQYGEFLTVYEPPPNQWNRCHWILEARIRNLIFVINSCREAAAKEKDNPAEVARLTTGANELEQHLHTLQKKIAVAA